MRLETTSVMNQSTCILVAVATNSLRAREKWNTKRSVELKYISVQRQRNKMIILRVGGSCF